MKLIFCVDILLRDSYKMNGSDYRGKCTVGLTNDSGGPGGCST